MLGRLAAEGTWRPFAARANVLFPGLYAWATTVAVPAGSAGATGVARAMALLALVALVLGPLLSPTRPELGRAFGIHGFVGLSVLAWALLTRGGVPLGVEPLNATLGALGWVGYAFGWGELRGRGSVPEDDPRVVAGPPLAPRNVLGRSIEPVLALGLLGAALLVYAAFRVARPAHSVLAHAASTALCLWLSGAAARVALDRGPRELPAASERLSRASTALATLVIALGLGALYVLLAK